MSELDLTQRVELGAPVNILLVNMVTLINGGIAIRDKRTIRRTSPQGIG